MSSDEPSSTQARFTYFRAFAIAGLTLPTQERDLGEIAPGVQLIVSQNVDERCFHADEATAIAELLLCALFAPAELPSASDRIDHVVKRNVATRVSRHGQGPFALFLCRGTIEDPCTDGFRELDDRWIGFDAVNKDAIREKYEAIIRSTLASLALNFQSVIGCQSVVDQVIVYRTDSRRILSYTATAGSVRVRANYLVDDSQLTMTASQAAAGVLDASVNRVQELLLRSLLADDDRLRAFLSAWTALEILINKLFSRYEKLLFDELGKDRSEPMPQYFTQIRKVMASRYRLKDKFTVISAALDPVSASADLAVFKKAKSLRDELAHGENIGDDVLPLEVTRDLLRKYLGLHLVAVPHNKALQTDGATRRR
ncbi:MAG TPA: hypothetical protein VH374_19825 [Polyangia bacterium]|jgi:hypothetical protein|nr:hypothetical protein [Polyangia bacterium]